MAPMTAQGRTELLIFALAAASLCLLLCGQVARAQELTLSKNLPADERYWEYQKRYQDTALLHVIISGEDKAHVVSVLEKVKTLKERGVSIGELVILSARWDPGAGGSAPSLRRAPQVQQRLAENVSQILKSFALDATEIRDGRALIEKYEVEFSPTWIVQHRGKQFVYEGLRNAQRLFTSEGEYRAE